jgi:hypothetical protein
MTIAKSTRRAATILTLCLATLAARGQTPATPQAPAYDSLDQALVVGVVGDVLGAIDDIDAFIASIAPAMGPETTKGQMKMQLQDPDLVGFQDGAGAALAVFDQRVRVVVIDVGSDLAETYAARMAEAGNENVEAVDGTLVVSKTDDGLALGRKLAAQIRDQLLAGADSKAEKFTVYVGRAWERYGAQVEAMLQTFSAGLGAMQAMAAAQTGAAQSPDAAPALAGVLEAYGRTAISLIKQIETLDVRVEPSAQGVRLDVAATPVAGSGLEKLAAAEVTPSQGLSRGLGGQGAIRGQSSINGPALGRFFSDEVAAVLRQVDIPRLDAEATIAWLSEAVAIYGDGFAMDYVLPDGPMVSGGIVMLTPDPAVALGFLREMREKMASTGLTAFYEAMGQTFDVEFTENVREHNGVAIHGLLMQQELTNLPPESAEAIKAMMGEMAYDIAILDDRMIYAMTGVKIEDLIDAARDENAPEMDLAAKTIFGPNQHTYVDLEVGQVLEKVMGLVSQQLPPDAPNPLAGIAAALSQGAPISLASRCGGSEVQVSLWLPMGLLRGIAMIK